MLYPFCVVILYSLLQLVKIDSNVPVPMIADKTKLSSRKVARIITFMLDYGLPCTVTVLIIVFWVLGTSNIIDNQ